ncbi:MAG: hypothetical protein WD873_05875, partial [Candidatus Hydrogenedentales bacterium]
NEQTGETRVNWFIGIVAAVLGGLATLATSDPEPQIPSVATVFTAALVSLLAFGGVTLLRLIKRNEVTDGIK